MFEQGNAEADNVTETLDNAVSEILDPSFVAAPKDTPPVIAVDDDDVAIVEVPYKNTTNKLYHKNTESWEEQINTVLSKKLKCDDIFETPESERSSRSKKKTGKFLEMNNVDRKKDKDKDKDMDFNDAKTKVDAVKALLSMSVTNIKDDWTASKGKKICAKAQLAPFLASLIASFRITGCKSVGASAWNEFQVLFAMKRGNVSSLYSKMYDQQVLLMGSRIGAALLQNFDFVEGRKCFLILGASMAGAIKRLNTSWENPKEYQMWKNVPWCIDDYGGIGHEQPGKSFSHHSIYTTTLYF
jgi:hypothetical protein